MRITADTGRCIGSGMCVLTAPEIFDQRDDDGIVVVRAPEPTSTQQEEARLAVQLCPSGALRVLAGEEPSENADPGPDARNEER